jgi:hypothetical protein
MKFTRKIGALVVSLVVLSSLLTSSALAAASNGTPFNELWAAILGIRTDAAALQAEVDSLQATVEAQAAAIADLQAQIDAMGGGTAGLPAPDYDSGWVPFAISETGTHYFYAEHGLNTKELVVYVYGRTSESGTWHQFNLNDFRDGVYQVAHNGAYWYCSTQNRITVITNDLDSYWVQVRVLIWKIPEAAP